MSAIFAFLHFLAAFGIFATLFYEWLTFNKNLTVAEASNIRKCDLWYGISAATVLVVGFLRVFYFGKGSEFYFSNTFFYIKLGLYLLIGLLSIYPTLRFMSWKKGVKENRPPKMNNKEYSRISVILSLELCLFFALLLSASLMAKGVSI